MMMARANCRAVSPTTACSAVPSRRCRCQSSGRVIVSWVRVWVDMDKPQGRLLCQRHAALGQRAEHRTAQRNHGIIEIESRIMQHAARFGAALAQAEIRALL